MTSVASDRNPHCLGRSRTWLKITSYLQHQTKLEISSKIWQPWWPRSSPCKSVNLPKLVFHISSSSDPLSRVFRVQDQMKLGRETLDRISAATRMFFNTRSTSTELSCKYTVRFESFCVQYIEGYIFQKELSIICWDNAIFNQRSTPSTSCFMSWRRGGEGFVSEYYILSPLLFRLLRCIISNTARHKHDRSGRARRPSSHPRVILPMIFRRSLLLASTLQFAVCSCVAPQN